MKRSVRSTWLWVALALGVTLAGTIGAWARYRQPHLLLAWKPFILTQHQFDYELEFVKRGFVGEAMRQLHLKRDVVNISLLSWAVLVALATALVRLHRRLPNSPDSAGCGKGSHVWLWALFLSPALFLQAGGDLGRLDPLLVLYEVGLIFLAAKRGWFWHGLAAVLTGIAVATHELFLLAQWPAVLAVHAYLALQDRESRHAHGMRFAVIVIAGVGAALWIASKGRMDGNSLTEYMAYLQQHRIDAPNPEGVSVLYYSVGENMRSAWSKLAAKAPWGIPLAAMVTGVYFWAARRAVRPHLPGLLLLIVGAIAPLTLLLLAYDYGRWFSFSVVNLLLAMTVCAQNAEHPVDWKPLRWTLPLAVLGPFGVTIGFPWWLG